MKTDSIRDWLRTDTLINRFCTQNGWIDDDSVRYEVSAAPRSDANADAGKDPHWVRINVYFTELVMEGSGCVADRVECFGQVDLRLGADGRVAEARQA